MTTPEPTCGEAPADLPLILQDLLDEIEALNAAGARQPTTAPLQDEVRELRALRGR